MRKKIHIVFILFIVMILSLSIITVSAIEGTFTGTLDNNGTTINTEITIVDETTANLKMENNSIEANMLCTYSFEDEEQTIIILENEELGTFKATLNYENMTITMPLEEIEEDEEIKIDEKSAIAQWLEEKINIIIAAISSLGLSVGTIVCVLKWLKGKSNSLVQLGAKYGLSSDKLEMLSRQYSENIDLFEKNSKALTDKISNCVNDVGKLKGSIVGEINNLENQNSMLFQILRLVILNDKGMVSKGISEEVAKIYEEYEKSKN